MNKASVDKYIPAAYDALKTSDIVGKDGKIDPAFRGQIATFGAAVSMGSLLSAIAFFSEQNAAAVDRAKLLDAILSVLHKDKPDDCQSLYQYAAQHPDCREDVLNAAIALKLAINLYPKRKTDKDSQQERTP